MPSITQRINAVTKHINNPNNASRALADALTYANPDEINPIAIELLRRPTNLGCATLIQHYHKTSESIKNQIIALYPTYNNLINPALDKCCKSVNERTRLNALTIIGLQKNLACITALMDNLCSETKSLSRTAAEVLFLITEACYEKTLNPAPTTSQIDCLDKAVAIAVDTYPKHRQHPVLMAAALLTNKPGPHLARWLNDREHPSHMSMRGVLKHLHHSITDDSLLAWLGIDTLSQQVLNRINQIAKSPETLPKLLAQAHLTKIPAQNHRIARLDKRRPCTVTSDDALKKLNDLDQSRLPRWISVIPLENQDRIHYFADGLSFKKPLARLANLKYLIDSTEATSDKAYARCANDVVASYCFDPEENIARIALHHCLHHKHNLADSSNLSSLLQTLAQSPHPSVRRLARNHIIEINFQQVWNLWESPDINPDTRRIITNQLINTDIIYFINELRKKLQISSPTTSNTTSSSNSTDRRPIIQTIRICTAHNLLPDIELELLTCAKNKDPHIVAVAVTALGKLKDRNAATQVIQAAVYHKDSRVRANAIEQLLDKSRKPLLTDLREDIEKIAVLDDNRPRANAINVLSQLDQSYADKRLDMMLADRRPLHRISALWLIENKQSTAHSSAVANIIRTDTNAKVRESARKTAGKLLDINYKSEPKSTSTAIPITTKIPEIITMNRPLTPASPQSPKIHTL